MFGGCQVSADCFNDVSVLDTMEPCPEECGSHGTCVDGRCCQCTAPGFTGHDCLQPLTCHSDCGLHGLCAQDGQCACSGGWSGENCQEPPRCPGATLPCSGRGECLSGGTCRCQAGAAGPDCFADIVNHSSASRRSPFFARRLMQGLLSLGTETDLHQKKEQPVSTSDFGIARVNQDGHQGEGSLDCEDMFCREGEHGWYYQHCCDRRCNRSQLPILPRNHNGAVTCTAKAKKSQGHARRIFWTLRRTLF